MILHHQVIMLFGGKALIRITCKNHNQCLSITSFFKFDKALNDTLKNYLYIKYMLSNTVLFNIIITKSVKFKNVKIKLLQKSISEADLEQLQHPRWSALW